MSRISTRTKKKHLRAHPEGTVAWDRLPFVGKDHGKHHNCWDVPMTGTYLGGIEVGRSIAHIYLKYLRDERSNKFALSTSLLGSMLTSMAVKQPASKGEQEVFNGQRVGFLYELSLRLQEAAVKLGHDLDRVSESQLIDTVNKWLDIEAYPPLFRELG